MVKNGLQTSANESTAHLSQHNGRNVAHSDYSMTHSV